MKRVHRQFLLSVVVGTLLTGCQSSTVHYSLSPRGLARIPASGGSIETVEDPHLVCEGIACSADGQRLYLARQSAITVLRLDGSGHDVLARTGQADCVALDEKRGRAWWGDMKLGHVASCDLKDGAIKVVFPNVAKPFSVAVDARRGVVYWVDDHPNRGVWKAGVDGSGRRKVWAAGGLLRCITVDQRSGRIFWSDWGGGSLPTRIHTLGPDGGDAEELIVFQGSQVKVEALAVDSCGRRIIWSQRDNGPEARGRIYSARFDGSDVKPVQTFTGKAFAKGLAVGPPREEQE